MTAMAIDAKIQIRVTACFIRRSLTARLNQESIFAAFLLPPLICAIRVICGPFVSLMRGIFPNLIRRNTTLLVFGGLSRGMCAFETGLSGREQREQNPSCVFNDLATAAVLHKVTRICCTFFGRSGYFESTGS